MLAYNKTENVPSLIKARKNDTPVPVRRIKLQNYEILFHRLQSFDRRL
jgi:hypothetical protein